MAYTVTTLEVELTVKLSLQIESVTPDPAAGTLVQVDPYEVIDGADEVGMQEVVGREPYRDHANPYEPGSANWYFYRAGQEAAPQAEVHGPGPRSDGREGHVYGVGDQRHPLGDLPYGAIGSSFRVNGEPFGGRFADHIRDLDDPR